MPSERWRAFRQAIRHALEVDGRDVARTEITAILLGEARDQMRLEHVRCRCGLRYRSGGVIYGDDWLCSIKCLEKVI